ALADRYSIEPALGRGGMAVVYLAHDVKHDRQVALKVLLPELAAALGSDRFLREIKVTAKLQHPHILPLYDSGEADGLLYYVMPYVEGESLRDRLNRETQLPIDDALRITEQVAAALDYAHRHEVIHRDIKPENILLHEGEAMVADFGIALAVTAAGGERLTETGLSVGTPEYMSPEQVAGEREIDARSDIYSLACVLYETLAGQPPFTAATAQAVLARHVTDPVPPITTARASVSRPVASAITKALGKAPADRFSTANEFMDALVAQTVQAEPETKSIVVLPFENLSPDPDNAFFADGLTEELIADLSKVGSLRVISRASAMSLKGSKKGAPTIARELNVRYALEGSVRRAGNNLRITAQLIDAESDEHLWAEKYGGTLDDVFNLQEQLSRQIVRQLEITLTTDEDRRLAVRPIREVQAYDAWLRARQAALSLTKEGIDHAFALINQALGVIGDNALLHATLAWLHALSYPDVVSDDSALELSQEHAKRAAALQPDLPWAQFAMGLALQRRGDLAGFVRYGKRALELQRDSHTLAVLGWYLAQAGRIADARRYADEAITLDPLTWLSSGARAHVDVMDGRFEAAIERLRGSVEKLAPGVPWPTFCLAYAMACAGLKEEAVDLFALNATRGDSIWSQGSDVLRCVLRGDRSGVDDLLENTGAIDIAKRDSYWAILLASAFAYMGDASPALDCVERGIELGFTNHRFLAELCPFLAPLRGNSRFQALIERAREKEQALDV
ncbi:MAG: protein kinase, partial [Gemmatimonadales bacterium]|nr:protein kinase [Gemmatimonadales bacterium]NIN10901.1 protein kinase [Gemmatimonadales bacterium]NIN49499.1 protein kinase [Gemmatimonadales bacterium]NIP06963.1 protein kinase [Gemmatimonadales bacterium]NIR00372.1 protein kinase [Gemmatimonadales bacterium]